MSQGRKIVVYIAGPYRAEHEFGVFGNILAAREIALDVWKLGVAQKIPLVALCPHMNTALFGGACPDAVWLEGDLELLRRCDAVMLVPGWEKSDGTRAEVEEAKRLGLPVFETLSGLGKWAGEMQALMAKGPSEFDNMMQILREAVTITGRLHGVMKDVDESAAIQMDDAGDTLMEAIKTIDWKREKGWKAPERVEIIPEPRVAQPVAVEPMKIDRQMVAWERLGLGQSMPVDVTKWNRMALGQVRLLPGVKHVQQEQEIGFNGGGPTCVAWLAAHTTRGEIRGSETGTAHAEMPSVLQRAILSLVEGLHSAGLLAFEPATADQPRAADSSGGAL